MGLWQNCEHLCVCDVVEVERLMISISDFYCSNLFANCKNMRSIHTDENPTDMFTKAVTVEKLKLCSALVGLDG